MPIKNVTTVGVASLKGAKRRVRRSRTLAWKKIKAKQEHDLERLVKSFERIADAMEVLADGIERKIPDMFNWAMKYVADQGKKEKKG